MNRRLSTQDVQSPARSSLSGPSRRRACGNKPQARASAVDSRCGQDARLLRGPRRELYGRRRSSASGVGRHPQRLSRFAARRVHVDRRPASIGQGASRTLSPARRTLRARAGLRASRLVDARDGLFQRPPASALYARPRLRPCAITSTRCRKRSAEGCCSKIRRLMSPFAN